MQVSPKQAAAAAVPQFRLGKNGMSTKHCHSSVHRNLSVFGMVSCGCFSDLWGHHQSPNLPTSLSRRLAKIAKMVPLEGRSAMGRSQQASPKRTLRRITWKNAKPGREPMLPCFFGGRTTTGAGLTISCPFISKWYRVYSLYLKLQPAIAIVVPSLTENSKSFHLVQVLVHLEASAACSTPCRHWIDLLRWAHWPGQSQGRLEQVNCLINWNKNVFICLITPIIWEFCPA